MFAFATDNDVGQQGNPTLYPVKGKEALITGAARSKYRVADSLVHNLAKNGMPVVNIWEAFSKPGKYNIHEITADIQLPREEKQT
jgi:hypothetical protein